ncbi:MAG: hypothetical protein ABWX65_10680 [Mycetocola sp.]
MSEEMRESDDALMSQLRLVEDQPLADRARAYVQLHEELRVRLEGGDAVASRS